VPRRDQVEQRREVPEQQRLVLVDDDGGGGVQALDVDEAGDDAGVSRQRRNAIRQVDELLRALGVDADPAWRQMAAGASVCMGGLPPRATGRCGRRRGRGSPGSPPAVFTRR
jgi:hypothetical protein